MSKKIIFSYFLWAYFLRISELRSVPASLLSITGRVTKQSPLHMTKYDESLDITSWSKRVQMFCYV